MRGKSQFRNSLLCTLSLTAAMALLVLLAFIPSWGQNPIPPTAREAAASPAFAAKLHPPTRPAMNKPRAAIHAPGKFGSPQSQSCANRYSPDCGGGPAYDNGPINGSTDAWTINFGYIVSDTFVLSGTPVTSFDLGVWEFPGDVVSSLQWSITSSPNGGTVYGSGTVSGSNLTDTFISTNQYGYNIDKISASGLYVNVTSGSTYWVNFFNASVPSGDPVFWDENSGKGCGGSDGNGANCPSQAVESAFGTIPSEAFDINGGPPPPPPSCFQSGGGMQIIYNFTQQQGYGGANGLTSDKAGNFYGTTGGLGDYNVGLAYELSPKGQGWVFNPLYNFLGGVNGSGPSPVIVGPDEALYGTASGGIQNCGGGYCGLVFSLRPAPTACLTALCSWTESVLYQPTGDLDAFDPGSLVADRAGNLYGTSGSGGAYGHGAVFELTPSNGGWTQKILYSFTGGSDGGYPNSLLVGIDGNLYGTAGNGGIGNCYQGCGVVFQLVNSGSGWTEQVLYNFTGQLQSGGEGPGSLVQDSSGNFYGVSGLPADNLYVLVFTLSPSNGGWTLGLLYQSPLIRSGGIPWVSGLAIDAAGNVYFAMGVTNDQYHDYWGKVLMRPPGGDFSDLWDGYNVHFTASGPLATDADGNVYGTTLDCGKYASGSNWGYGTVWNVTH